MYQEEEKKPLIIPENCPPVKYPVVNGYTDQDMKYIGITTCISFVIAIISYIRNSNIFISLGIVIFMIAVSIILRGRDKYAENFIDKIRIHRDYKKTQKSFTYEKLDIM